MMSCLCATTALRRFIRDVAHLEFKPVLCKPFTISVQTPRLKFSTLNAKQLHYTSRNNEDAAAAPPQNTLLIKRTPYSNASASENKSYARSRPARRPSPSYNASARRVGRVSNLRPKRQEGLRDNHASWEAIGAGVESQDARSSRSTFHADGPATLEITPENLAALSKESSEANVRRIPKPLSTKRGFALHFSSPPIPEAERLKLKKAPTKTAFERPPKPVVEHDAYERPEREHWQIQKAALKEKFPEGWNPLKKLSPDALEGIRALHAQFPDLYTTTVLAQQFEVAPEAIRRILKSKWKPKEDEEIERNERWFARGKSVWERYSKMGMKPPVKWRQEGIGNLGAAISRARKNARPRPIERPTVFATGLRGAGKRTRAERPTDKVWTTSRAEDVTFDEGNSG